MSCHHWKKKCFSNNDDREGLESEETVEAERFYFNCFFFFNLNVSWKPEEPIRLYNTWQLLSDRTIWCKSGFDSGHNTDWLHPLNTGSLWQKQSTANQSSCESSQVGALLIILLPLGQKPICLIFNTTNFPHITLTEWLKALFKKL